MKFTFYSSSSPSSEALHNKNESAPSSQKHASQWSEKNFDDDARQDKFLRLMGGKKGHNKQSSQQFSTQSSANKVSEMNQALEKQFNQAREFNMQKRYEGNKTKGLGFSAAHDVSNKTFHIDVTKKSSNSIKFDDSD